MLLGFRHNSQVIIRHQLQQTVGTINLKATGLAQSYSGNYSGTVTLNFYHILRVLGTIAYSESYDFVQVSFSQQLSGTQVSDTFASVNEKVLRPVNSEQVSGTYASINEKILRPYNGQVILQSLANGNYTLSLLTFLKSTAVSQSFSGPGYSIKRSIYSQIIAESDAPSEISVQQNKYSQVISNSETNVNEQIQRKLASTQISDTYILAEESVQRNLASEIICSSISEGQYLTNIQRYFQTLSFRRYSSQYYVQGGNVNDDGQ